MVVMEELGRGLVSAPFAGSLVAPAAAAKRRQAACRPTWLPRIAAGAGPGGAGAAGTRRALPAARTCARDAQPMGGALRAERRTRAWCPPADEADAFMVPARLAGSDDDIAGIGLLPGGAQRSPG
jgi:hypothetical protein